MNQMKQMQLPWVDWRFIFHCLPLECESGQNRQFFVLPGGLNVIHRHSFSSLSPKWPMLMSLLMNQMKVNEGRVAVWAKLRCRINKGAERESGCFWMLANELAFYIDVHCGAQARRFGWTRA